MPENKPGDLPEDLDDLARRYVDLWQDQMTALAADPAFAESMQKVMATMGVAASGLPAAWTAWPAAMSSLMAAARPGAEGATVQAAPMQASSDVQGQETQGEPAGKPKREHEDAGAVGAAATAAPPHGGGLDLGVLEERLAALERRVLALEGRAGRTRSRAKGKPEWG